MSISATLIRGAIASLQDMRNSPERSWSNLLGEAKSFAQENDLSIVFKDKGVKKVKKMPGELANDEPTENGEQAFINSVFIPVLDTLIVHLQERFSDHDTELLKAMHVFTPSYLLANEAVVVDNGIY